MITLRELRGKLDMQRGGAKDRDQSFRDESLNGRWSPGRHRAGPLAPCATSTCGSEINRCRSVPKPP